MAFLNRARSFAAAAGVAAALSGGATVADAGPQTGAAEADIKAAFLFNFTKFVEWSDGAAAGPFQICTLADARFDAVLAHTLSGESTDGRPIVRVTPEAPEFASACHILFISRGEDSRVGRWVAAVQGHPVLIVGESKAAADAGAEITFVVEDNRVKFDVNEDAASRAGLKISSKLLRVARRVTARGTR
jgi:YfiR/HmsC-like